MQLPKNKKGELVRLRQSYDDDNSERILEKTPEPKSEPKIDISINIKEIREYTGTGKTTIQEFVEKIETYAAMEQWTPQQITLIASSRLNGLAKVIERQLKEDKLRHTFEELAERLKQKFAGTQYKQQLKKILNKKTKLYLNLSMP